MNVKIDNTNVKLQLDTDSDISINIDTWIKIKISRFKRISKIYGSVSGIKVIFQGRICK